MRQLSGHQASFLHADTLQANSNVTFVQIYDPSTAPGGRLRFKSILAHIESRLHLSPVFRSRLLRVPLGLDDPYWVEDELFDLEYHVRHIALPQPGDWRQFCIQASRIHARALDLSRALWEIYVIEGLDSITDLPAGSFALLTKIHQAAIDVESRNEVIDVLHDSSPHPPAAAPPEPWFPQRPPGALALGGRSLANVLRSPLKLLRPLARRVPAAMAFAGDLLHPRFDPAATRFNAVVSPHRVFDTRRFMLEELHAIRGLVRGASVNDAVLALCAGGLRSYLALHGELPAASLAALAPVGIHGADHLVAGAQARSVRVDLGTNLQDPLQRLRRIHEQTAPARSVAQAASGGHRAAAGARASTVAPAIAGQLGARVSGLARSREPLACCSVSNVVGPGAPLYLVGARMSYFSAIMPIADGMGLVFAVTCYDARVLVSPTSCRELMPDPQAFTQCLRDSFQEMLALARRGSGPVAPDPPAQRPSRRARSRASASDRRSPKRPPARSASTAPRAGPAGRR